MTLTTPSLLELSNLFERSGFGISSTEGDCLRGIPRWEMQQIPSVIANEIQPWLDCIGYAGQILVDRGDERVEVDLQETDEPDKYHYRCPETFRMKPIPESEVAVHAVNPGRFLHLIAELLAIPMAFRKGIQAPIIDDVLWHLGKASLGPAHVDIWLARSLALNVEKVFEQLALPTRPEQGIVLTTGLSLSGGVKPPRDYRVASLGDVLVQSVPEPVIDRTVLYQCLTQLPGSKMEKCLPVQWDPHTWTLTINTRSINPWKIKGKKQAAAITYMFKQALNDRWWLPAHEILNAVNPQNKTASSARMQNLFSANPEWDIYITTKGKGTYGFRLS